MNRARTFAACLASVERGTVVPLRREPVKPVAGFYGSDVKLSPLFVQGKDNACPACNARSWNVGRITAECAVCETALPIVQPFDRNGGFK
jgi:hypothetical protein